MNRQEHLDWCKKRAIEYCEVADVQNAFLSFQSDMKKHPETANHPALELMTHMLFIGQLSTPGQMQHFIEGFN